MTTQAPGRQRPRKPAYRLAAGSSPDYIKTLRALKLSKEEAAAYARGQPLPLRIQEELLRRLGLLAYEFGIEIQDEISLQRLLLRILAERFAAFQLSVDAPKSGRRRLLSPELEEQATRLIEGRSKSPKKVSIPTAVEPLAEKLSSTRAESRRLKAQMAKRYLNGRRGQKRS